VEAVGIKIQGDSRQGRRILACKDLGDIDLREWDSWGANVRTHNGSKIDAVMHFRGDCWTLAGMVCILKEAALRLRESEGL
jgi:hypothetical protein